MDLFDEISKTKQEIPKVKTIKNEVVKYKLNFYQIFAIGLFIVFFFLGIVFGNLFSTCEAASYYYFSNTCVNKFNFSLMILSFKLKYINFAESITFFSLSELKPINIISQNGGYFNCFLIISSVL